MSIFQPLEQLIITLLTYYHSVTNHYGISLILLSLSMTIIMFPLFIIAERIQRRDHKKKEPLQADLEKLKDVKNSQERYFYTKRLYKIYNYHPISSLKGLIGLLIQIPFFMAAYRSLAAYTGFNGIGFLFIENLGNADGTLWGVNVLPILMTIINLLGSFLYAKDKNRSEKIQLFFIGMVFLFLLYDKPSALLVYWTCNNFFAIFKNALLERDIFYRELNYLKPLNFLTEFVVGNKRLDGNRGIFITIQGLLGIVALVALYLSDSVHYIDLGFDMMFYLFICYGIFLSYIFLLHYKEKRSNIIYLLTFCLFILSFMLVGDIIKRRKFFIICYLFFNITLFLSFFAYHIDKFLDRHTPDLIHEKSLISKGLILYTAIVLVINPTVIYNSSPVDFTYGYIRYISICVLIWGGLSLVINQTVKLLNRRLLNYLLLLTVLILFTTIFNQFIFKGDYGVLDNFTFKDVTKLYPQNRYFTSVASILLATGVLIYLIKSQFRLFKQIIQFITLFFILLSMVSFITKQDSITISKEYNTNKINFSSNKPNVVVFYMDRLSAGLVGYALEEYPELISDLDGFTFYNSVISNGSSTLFGAPAALGGSEYSVEANNSRNDLSNTDKISEAFSIVPYLMGVEAGFDTKVYGLPFFDRIPLKDSVEEFFYYNLNKELEDVWLAEPENAYYSEVESINLQSEISNLIAISMFRTTFPAARAHIYNKGNWWSKDGKIIPSIGNYAVIDLLTKISYISEDRDNNGNYHWIASDFVHRPGGIGYDLQPSKDPKVSAEDMERFGHNRETVFSYYNVVVFLQKISNWVDWMKEHGVYDNTRIIITSDHGFKYSVDYYFDPLDIPQELDREILKYFHTSLFVKDFNSRGLLKTDDTLLSNSAFVSMVTRDIIDSPINPYTGEEIKSLNPAEGLFMNFTLDWDLKMNPKNSLRYHKKYRVKGTDLDNLSWEQLE